MITRDVANAPNLETMVRELFFFDLFRFKFILIFDFRLHQGSEPFENLFNVISFRYACKVNNLSLNEFHLFLILLNLQILLKKSLNVELEFGASLIVYVLA